MTKKENNNNNKPFSQNKVNIITLNKLKLLYKL